MYTLYYYPRNANLAPHYLLRYMDLDYQLELVDRKSNAQKSAAYMKLNPSGRIPTLVDDDLVLFESPAICIYLCEQHPEHGLIPPIGDKQRPLFFQWLAYLNNTLQTELLLFHYPQRHTTDSQGADSIVAAQHTRLADILAVIDDQLGMNAYLIGDKITACDFFLFMLVGWAMPMNKSPLAFSHLADYLQRIAQIPSVREVAEIEGVDLSAFD
ncbi:glutathione S-transferase family protein [Thaumasiovibrio subtropicus]|uniref:glutathione S-transferase family protein n=1 Tax=Thaumasiovibrio subtropicus TaxID=1891207 RepID=UPI000B34BDD6|nr:glutathione S-transferase family protein [Thaumasiovibrio subtropicus]